MRSDCLHTGSVVTSRDPFTATWSSHSSAFIIHYSLFIIHITITLCRSNTQIGQSAKPKSFVHSLHVVWFESKLLNGLRCKWKSREPFYGSKWEMIKLKTNLDANSQEHRKRTKNICTMSYTVVNVQANLYKNK